MPGGSGSGSTGMYEDPDPNYYTLEETGGDSTLVGSAAYYEAAVKVQNLKYEVDVIASPSMLQNIMPNISERLDECRSLTNSVSDEDEKQRLTSEIMSINNLFAQRCREYKMPAAGIIDNLLTVTYKVEQAKDAGDLKRIMEPRYGYFKNLSTLYMIVEEESKVAEVRRLSKNLEQKFNQKKRLFGVE